MTPFAQTSVRITTIRHHTEHGTATTAHNARLRLHDRSAGPFRSGPDAQGVVERLLGRFGAGRLAHMQGAPVGAEEGGDDTQVSAAGHAWTVVADPARGWRELTMATAPSHAGPRRGPSLSD